MIIVHLTKVVAQFFDKVLFVTLFLISTKGIFGFDQSQRMIMAWLATVMIINKMITVVITVTDTEGVTNLPHYKNSRPEN